MKYRVVFSILFLLTDLLCLFVLFKDGNQQKEARCESHEPDNYITVDGDFMSGFILTIVFIWGWQNIIMIVYSSLPKNKNVTVLKIIVKKIRTYFVNDFFP